MSLAVGTRLGPYEILSALGAGGMGEVYRARDTKLDRDVAIKVLPELFVSDPERVARFQREAKTLAALNHPHIGGIYGLEDADGVHALVLELVQGPTLADRIAQGPIPLDDALPIARQIAEAVEAAHEAGIIHRDLKPANIKLRPDGTVKVLDFGLAKSLEPISAASPNVTASPTITTPAMMTGIGMILGTAAYMSPEQAKGRPADKRSDVWAFGSVVYEMLTGSRAFKGEDVSDTLATVLKSDPDWSALPADVSPAMRTLISRCLAKDRRARIPDMAVARFFMTDANTAPRSVGAAQTNASRFSVAALGLIAGAATATTVTWTAMRPPPASRRLPARFALTMSSGQPVGLGGPDRVIAFSPDGIRIVSINGGTLGGGGQLMIRAIDQLDASPVRGLGNVRAPFISPDSRWIGYFDAGELKRVPMTGGPPISICQVTGGTRGSSWGTDNTIVFATNDATTGLLSVAATGGEPKVLTKPDAAHGEVDHFFPAILPDARAVLFTVIRTGPLESAEIAVLDLRTGQRKTVIRGGTHGAYVEVPTPSGPVGYVLYSSGGALRAIRFDAGRLEAEGDSVVVLDQVRTEVTGAAQFSVSRDGSLVYGVGGGAGYQNRTLVWVDRRGQQQPIEVPPRQYAVPRISPDGTHVALAISGQEQDIWVLDLPHLFLSRLTFGPALKQSPVWTPDGKRILFSSTQAGVQNVFWQPADNTGSMEQLTKSQNIAIPYSIAPSGESLLVSIAGGTDIGITRLDRPTEIAPLIGGPGSQINAEISPDGHWVAYQSAESGQYHIYVRPFPNVNAGRWQITTEQAGGVRPLWARNGRELFYVAGVDPDRALMTVPIQTTPTFQYGKPTKLFDARYFMSLPGRTFDVSPDGQRFLMIKEAQTADAQSSSPQTVIVLNWLEELKTRVPTK
jgi:eukaryotic-like serine/threonine-protein kinase